MLHLVLTDRMGNSIESLQLILEEEQDILWAIRLCKEHDDADLWNRLIEYALDKPGEIFLCLCEWTYVCCLCV